MLVGTQLLLELQYYAVVVGSSLARVDPPFCVGDWYGAAYSWRNGLCYGKFQAGVGAVAWREEGYEWVLRGEWEFGGVA